MAWPSRRQWLGLVVISVRMATPFRLPAKCWRAKALKLSQSVLRLLPPWRRTTLVLRSGSYRSSTLAWAKALVAPRLRDRSGLPSILMGRPS